MKKITLSELRIVAKDILFENQVSASGRPDGFSNLRHMMHHRPAPIDKEGNTDIPDEDNYVLPLVADDFVAGGYIGYSERNIGARMDPNIYTPANKKELSTYLTSKLDDYDNSEIDDKVIEKIFKSVNKILEKV